MDDRRIATKPQQLYDLDFAVSFVGQTLFVTGNTLLIHYARWIDFLGGDERDIGLVMGLAPVLSLLLRPWMGQWIDKVGARRAAVVGCAIVAGCTLLNFGLTSVGLAVYMSRTGMVVGGAVFFASSLTYITQTTPPERRTEAIGILGCGGFLGMVVGPYIGDLFLPGATNRVRGDFNLMFGVVIGSIVLAMLLIGFLRSAAKIDRSGQVGLASFIKTVRAHWPGAILLVDAVFGVGICIPFVFLAKYVDDVGLQKTGIGVYFAVYAAWAMALRLSLRKLPDRLGRRAMLMVGLAFLGLGSFSYLFVDGEHPSRLIIAALISGSAHSLMFHTMMALTLETFPLDQHGTGTVLAYMYLDIGMIAVAPILGYVAHHAGYPTMFISVGTLCFVTLAIYALAERKRALAKFEVESEILCPGEELTI